MQAIPQISEASMYDICLTLDVDWAPDWAISDCAEACARSGVAATFFATHQSPVLKELSVDDRFEVGIHPNFLANSSHGQDPKKVIETLLEWYPNATSMRTHALVQSTALWQMIAMDFPQISVDVSLLLPFHPIFGRFHYPIVGNSRLHRLAYNWEDDVSANDESWHWEDVLPTDTGLQVLDFHPVFLGMNLDRNDRYHRFKELYAGKFLTVTRDEMSTFDHNGLGARSYFEFVIANKATWYKVSETPMMPRQE